MADQYPLISIITVNFNQLTVTCEMLDSLQNLDYPNLEIIVVDNHSTTNPSKHLSQYYPNVKCIISRKNLGFAGGNNLGIAQAKGDYLFFVNNDTELTKGMLTPLLNLFAKVENLGVVCPKICYYPERDDVKDIIQYMGATPVNNYTARNAIIGEREFDEGQYQGARPTPYAHGAAMMVSKRVIDKVGMMPEDFFLYYEELDWCEQIRRAGFEIYVEPQSKIYHKESISVGKANPFKTYYLTRNRILFMRRNRTKAELALFTLFLVFVTIPKNVISYFVRGEFQHLQAFVKGVWWHVNQNYRKRQGELFPA